MRDVDHIVGQCEGLLAQSGAFCTEEQQAPLGEGIGFHRHCAGNNVEGDDAGGLKLLDACITSIDFGQQLMKVLVVSIHSHIMRMDGGGNALLCCFNFTPEPWTDYVMGLPKRGLLTEVFSTDAPCYGGTGEYRNAPTTTVNEPFGTFDQLVRLQLPPYGAVYLSLAEEETV